MIEIGTQLARAHRAPILEEMYSNAAHLGTGAYEIGDPDLGNEIGHGVDAFIRLRPGPVYFELAGFYNRVSNYIFLEPTGEFNESSAFPIYRYRAEGADFLGGELSLGLDIGAFKVKSGVDYVRATRQNLAGSPLPSIPPLRTRLDVGADLERFWLGTTARYVFAQERTAPGEFSTPGYALLGADGGLRFDAAGLHILSLRVENALNATYRDHLSRVPGRDVPMAGRNGQIIYRWIY